MKIFRKILELKKLSYLNMLNMIYTQRLVAKAKRPKVINQS